MSKTVVFTLTPDDRVALIAFGQKVFDNKLKQVDFADLVRTSKEPVVMLEQFRHDLRNLRLSYLVRQVESGHWVRYLKAWVVTEKYGAIIDPTSFAEVCHMCGFTGKMDEWQVIPERGKHFVYVNAAQVIEPGVTSSLIKVATQSEESYGRGGTA